MLSIRFITKKMFRESSLLETPSVRKCEKIIIKFFENQNIYEANPFGDEI